MKVIRDLGDFTPQNGTIVTVGTFDGIHLGHRQLITKTIEVASQTGSESTVLTFDPHPKAVIQDLPQKPIEVLTNLDEKLGLLQETGISQVVLIKFTREFSQLSYTEFVEKILLQTLKMRSLVVGYDHAFGRDRGGNLRSLEKLQKKDGFELYEIGPYQVDGENVSSSYIRRLISSGDVVKAARLLGRLYSFRGIVVKGEGRGKRLTFPTANISIHNNHKLLPREGVYAVDSRVADKVYRGMVNIGYKPTFGGLNKAVEVHLFDFSGNLYGEKITIEFLRRLREEKKFVDEKQLIEQLKKDKEMSTNISINTLEEH